MEQNQEKPNIIEQVQDNNNLEETQETTQEEIQEEGLTFDELYPDEELDEETLNIIYNRDVVEIDLDIGSNKKEKKEKNKKEKNDSLSLNEFLEKNAEKKPEKWVSGRTKGKRTETAEIKLVKEPKFKFNPRLPPYNTIQKTYEDKKTNMKVNDENNFPTLN